MSEDEVVEQIVKKVHATCMGIIDDEDLIPALREAYRAGAASKEPPKASGSLSAYEQLEDRHWGEP